MVFSDMISQTTQKASGPNAALVGEVELVAFLVDNGILGLDTAMKRSPKVVANGSLP